MDGYLLINDLTLKNAKFKGPGLVQMSPVSSKCRAIFERLVILDNFLLQYLFCQERNNCECLETQDLQLAKTEDHV